MAQSTRPRPPAAARPPSFLKCLNYFLTPQVWKQAHQAAGRRRALRWQTHPLLFVLLVMTWCAGDSLPERFETARAFYVALHQRCRRPGQTFAGFEKALGKVPLPVLRSVAAAVRQCFTLGTYCRTCVADYHNKSVCRLASWRWKSVAQLFLGRLLSHTGVVCWHHVRNGSMIGIGGRLTTPPLPHHLAYGSRTSAVRSG